MNTYDPRLALDPARRPIPSDLAALEARPAGRDIRERHRHGASRQPRVSVEVIALDDLIAIKRALGRPKDLLVATELEAIRERLRASDG